MRHLSSFVLLALLALPAWAAVALPDTPAAKTLQGWLDAVNSGDPERITAYYEEYLPGLPVPEGPVLPFLDSSEGFEVIAVLLSEPLSIDFVIKERAGDTRTVGHITVEESEPHRVDSIRFTIP